MSKPVSSLADVQSLAARCIEMADPQLDADFEAKFGQAPAVFAALPAQAQQAHLQSHADAAKGAKYAVGNWGHLFGSDRHETNCRIVIDVENGELVAAQEKDGLKFVDLRGERFRDLAESVIEVNEAHNGYLDYGLVLSNELPGWAGGLDNAVSTLQGNVQNSPRYQAFPMDQGNDQWGVRDTTLNKCFSNDGWQKPDSGWASVLTHEAALQKVNQLEQELLGNVAELAKYVADFESGVIASRGAINDASFDQKRLAASKEAIASGSDHDVKECLNWWAEAIASGSLVQGQGNVATSKDHPDAFFDAQGKLFDWETGDPMPQGWTGIAKRKDTLFVIGQDGEETSYTALYAKTMVDALKEAAARNLLGVQGNVVNCIEQAHQVRYVIRSLSESDVDFDGDAGAFWSNEDGWGSLQSATLFSTTERMSMNLPMSAKLDAEWMLQEEARDLCAKANVSEAAEESAPMFVSLDGGKTFLPATSGVRIIYKNVPVPGEDEPGELHLNATSEGVISDLWVSREEHLDHNLGTSSELVDDMIERLVDDPVLDHDDSPSPGM